PGPRCGTSGFPQHQTGPQQNAPPSDRHAQHTHAQPQPPNVKLPNNTNRNWLQTAIQYINTRVPDRTTNRHTCWKAVHLTTAICGRPNTTLSWAILIYQRNCREEPMVLDRQVRWACLTSENNRLQF